MFRASLGLKDSRFTIQGLKGLGFRGSIGKTKSSVSDFAFTGLR